MLVSVAGAKARADDRAGALYMQQMSISMVGVRPDIQSPAGEFQDRVQRSKLIGRGEMGSNRRATSDSAPILLTHAVRGSRGTAESQVIRGRLRYGKLN